MSEIKTAVAQSDKVERVLSNRESKYDKVVKDILALKKGECVVVTIPKGMEAVPYRNLLNTSVRNRLRKAAPTVAVRFYLTTSNQVQIVREDVAPAAPKKK